MRPRRIFDDITVPCWRCGVGFQTTERLVAAGRGRYCSRSCQTGHRFLRHGYSRDPTKRGTYVSWAAMLDRCRNTKNAKYRLYGGRGITVCERWEDFANFLADMGERPPAMSIDRIDGERGYEPDNCRWATRMEQQSHVSSNRFVTYGGETCHLKELSRKLGVRYNTLTYRVDSGWPIETWALAPHGKVRRRQSKATIISAPAHTKPVPQPDA